MSSFCDFRKMTFSVFTTFFSFLTQANLGFCPNMINFDSMDFSECHPEEVISFF